jgi:hypothetical protein
VQSDYEEPVYRLKKRVLIFFRCCESWENEKSDSGRFRQSILGAYILICFQRSGRDDGCTGNELIGKLTNKFYAFSLILFASLFLLVTSEAQSQTKAKTIQWKHGFAAGTFSSPSAAGGVRISVCEAV